MMDYGEFMNTNKNIIIKNYEILILFVYILIITGCTTAMLDESFSGKAIDSITKEPIKGAVALALWTTWMMTPAGDTTEYYDISETVTDNNGEFYIHGKGPKAVTNLNPMQITVLKAGYMESMGTVKSYSQYPKTQDGKTIISLQKLTPKQKKMRGTGPASPPDEAPIEKVSNFMRELNKDRVERGLTPIKQWEGVEHDKNN